MYHKLRIYLIFEWNQIFRILKVPYFSGQIVSHYYQNEGLKKTGKPIYVYFLFQGYYNVQEHGVSGRSFEMIHMSFVVNEKILSGKPTYVLYLLYDLIILINEVPYTRIC